MTKIFDLKQIKQVTNYEDAIRVVEEGFIIHSRGQLVVPPVGHLTFDDPPGNVHIKYGYIKNDNYYVIKIAGGFYKNAELGLPPGDGLMLVFFRETGLLASILLDEGYLTDLRTGAAGAVVAKYLAPRRVNRIGIIGTGTQARFQLEGLKHVVDCHEVLVWGRSQEKLDKLKHDVKSWGFNVQSTLKIADVPSSCNFIVTTTPSRSPLLSAENIQLGTHITAMGADSEGKQELDPKILQMADILVADKMSQCIDHGEIRHAIAARLVEESDIIELGNVVTDRAQGRTSDEQITIADLTGVAVQDIQIAKLVLNALIKTAMHQME